MKKKGMHCTFYNVSIYLFFCFIIGCATIKLNIQKGIKNINGKTINGRVYKFSHPGVLQSAEDIERIKQVVKQKKQPGYDSYKILIEQNTSSSDYELKGPYKILGRDGDYAYTKNGFEQDFIAAYHNALLWVITGKEAHAKKSVEIINEYSNKVIGIGGSNDNALTASTVFILANAAEIMRYSYSKWNKEDISKCEENFRNVYVKELNVFFDRAPYTNGNWGAACTKAMMSLGVFLNDTSIFNKAVDFYFSFGKDNGSIANYVINPTGQSQESGRDQPHVMFGLGCLAEACEIGYKQGLDMYAALDNRLMAGYEYLAQYNLGYTVPYIQWKDVTGKYSNWKEISNKGRGEFRPVFEIAYNAYVIRKKLNMPFVTEVLQKLRPEGVPFKADNLGYGTLLFYEK